MELEFDINKIKQKSEQIKIDFWSNDGIPYDNKELLSYYNEHEAQWITNAFDLRKNAPLKTNIFLANIYRSNFTFKLITDRLNFLNKKRKFTIVDKISLIKSAVENSYDYFALLAICANYSEVFYNSLYEKWNFPDKAREFIKSKNQWKINGEPVSGKKWTLLNCPLFNFSPISIEYLISIKNADSHQKLVITKNDILILDDKKDHITIKMKDFNRLFKYVRNTIFLAIGFNLTLAIKHNFWVSPVLILTNPQKFNYTKISLPNLEDIKKDTHRKKIRTGIKAINNKPKTEYIISIIYAFIEFIFKDMWLKIYQDESNINMFLSQFNLKLDTEKLNSFRIKSINDVFELFALYNYKVKTWYLGASIEKPCFEMKTDIVTELEIKDLCQDILTSIKKLNEDISNRKFILLFLIPGMVSILAPIRRLTESLKEILIEDENCS